MHSKSGRARNAQFWAVFFRNLCALAVAWTLADLDALGEVQVAAASDFRDWGTT
ncbi:hypothetical protein AIIKEEIJ_02926 [Rhodococcus sp. YH1]|nr:hypothetical protein [Rhodococcus sp. YH1]